MRIYIISQHKGDGHMAAKAAKPKTKKAVADEPTIPAIKGFNRDLTCRGFKFDPGQTYEVSGKVEACSNGFHSCPLGDEHSPLSVFEYYAPGISRYFEVEASGDTDRQGNKIASAKITVGVEIGVGKLVERAIEWFAARKLAKGTSNSGYSGAASNSGNSGAASNSGNSGAASNSGTRGAASNSGTRGAASNSGNSGAASNSGTRGAASNSGDSGAPIYSGYSGAASNSGNYGAASNSGDSGAASNSGTRGAAFSHAYGSKVMCEGDGQALYNTEFAEDGSIASVACGITGRDGVEAGVWYVCKDGKLVSA
jgi:hypothetical protein